MAGYRSGLSGASKGLRTMNKRIREQARYDARALSLEAKATKNRETGKYRSNITRRLYDTKEEAIRAGKISQSWARRRSENSSGIYEEAFEKKEKQIEFNNDLASARKEYKEEAKANGMDKDTIKLVLKALGRNPEMIRAAAENLGVELEEDDYDEDEWEEAEISVSSREQKEVTDDLWVYWEQVSHGLIGNSYYYLHRSGSWLYNHGYDGWNLTSLIKDPYTESEDGHTNLDFIEQALKDSGLPYEIAYDENEEPYISKKYF